MPDRVHIDMSRCEHCGFPVKNLIQAEETLALKEENLRDLESALRVERRKVAQLRAKQRDQEKGHPMGPQAREVFGYWKQTMAPRAKEFTGERFQAVVGRLEADWNVEDLKLAIDGARANPREGTTTDLHTICRNEKNLMMFMEWGKKARRHTGDPATRDEKLERQYDTYVTGMEPVLATRLAELRGWNVEAITGLGLGYDRASRRVVFPVHDHTETLVGFARWLPNPETRGRQAKNIAEGPRELFPPPERIDDDSVWLVEGEPDAVAMASIGQPAVAVPGVAIWKKGWEHRFAKFDRVRILFDCDEEGRKAAVQRQKALHDVVDEVQVIDLDPSREDKYDVGDFVMEHGENAATKLGQLSSGAGRAVRWLRPQTAADARPIADYDDGRPPIQKVLERLESSGCNPKRGGHDGQYEAKCPAHDDRSPSLSIGVGDDDRCLLNCHRGCEPGAILDALGLEWKDIFDTKEQAYDGRG